MAAGKAARTAPMSPSQRLRRTGVALLLALGACPSSSGEAGKADAKKADAKKADAKTVDAKTVDAKTVDAKTPDAKTPDALSLIHI